MGWLLRAGGVLWSPRRAFRRIVHGSEGGVGEVLGLMGLCLLGTFPLEVARVLIGLPRGAGAALSRLVLMYVGFSFWPLAVCLGAALVMVGFERVRGRRVPMDAAVAAGAYLWVPLGVLGMAGSVLEILGLPLAWLPHVSFFALLNQGAPWWLLAAWLVASCGWSVGLAIVLRGVLREDGPKNLEPLGRRGAVALAIAWLAAIAVGGVHATLRADELRPILPGDPAPAIALERLEGGPQLALAEVGGQVVVIEFWATWCPSCMESLPALEGWAARHADVPVLAIHQGGTREEVLEAVDPGRLRHLRIGIDRTLAASRAYRVDSVPMLFVIGTNGIIRAVHTGVPPPGWLDSQLGP